MLEFIKQSLGLFQGHDPSEQNMLKQILGTGDPPQTRNTENHLRSYDEMPLVRAIATKISGAVAKTEWKLYAVRRIRGTKEEFYKHLTLQRCDYIKRESIRKRLEIEGNLTELTDHPVLDLLHAGNSMLTGMTIRRLMQDYIDLVGDCYLYKERNEMGIPVRFWPVPSHWIYQVPVAPGDRYQVRYGTWQELIADEDILWLKNARPENPYGRGTGFGNSISDELETDEYAAKFMKAVFFNRAKPDLIVMPGEKGMPMKQDETVRFERRWLSRLQGVMRSWRPMVLRRWMEIKSFTQDFQSVQMKDLRTLQRDIVYQTYGIPPEIMGVLTNSNRSTIAAADYHFAEYCVLPRLEFLRNEFQEKIIPEFDDRILIDYVSPIREDVEHKLNVAKSNPASLMVDEWREMSGHKPLPNKKGQVFLVPLNMIPMKKLDQSELPDDPSTDGVGSDGGGMKQRELAELPQSKLYKLLEARMIMDELNDDQTPDIKTDPTSDPE